MLQGLLVAFNLKQLFLERYHRAQCFFGSTEKVAQNTPIGLSNI